MCDPDPCAALADLDAVLKGKQQGVDKSRLTKCTVHLGLLNTRGP